MFSVLCPQSLRGLAILLLKGENVVLSVLRRSTNQVLTLVAMVTVSVAMVT